MSGVEREITIYLIEDQAMIRAAFRSMLQAVEHFSVIGDSEDARTGIAEVVELRPDIVILDITMPGLSGLDAIGPIKKSSQKTKILMASQHEGQGFVRQALQSGADGYLSKDSEPEEMRLAIESIHRGDSYLSPRVASTLLGKIMSGGPAEPPGGASLQQLTAREREVFQLIAVGKSNKEIASLLNLSIGTVKKHRENLQRKLDCHSAAELARLAIREGLLSI